MGWVLHENTITPASISLLCDQLLSQYVLYVSSSHCTCPFLNTETSPCGVYNTPSLTVLFIHSSMAQCLYITETFVSILNLGISHSDK